MTLQSSERKAIVEYRKDKALRTMKEAKDVAALGHWSLAVQRLYYATYYAQSALLINNGASASSHAGVKALIGLKYVKQGLLNSDDNSLLGKLFSMRQTGDYGDTFDWRQEDVEPLINKTELLVDKIISFI